eukprot:1964782-Rhodomonas_salina.2
MAAGRGNSDGVSLLVASSADIEQRDTAGRSALHYAASAQDAATVRLRLRLLSPHCVARTQ